MRIEFFLLSLAALTAGLGCAARPAGRSVIDSVRLKGAKHIDGGDLVEHLATAPSPKFLGLFRGLVHDYSVLNQRTLDLDLRRVERYYRARGYYEARARSGLIVPTKTGHVSVTIVVEEGPPVRVRKVTVAGLTSIPVAVQNRISKRLAHLLVVDAPFDEAKYQEGEERISAVLTDAAYAFAKVTRHAQVDLATRTAEVSYTVVPGPQAVLGEISFQGLGDLPESPVRRAFQLQPGMPYSSRALDAARVSLMDLGVFANVRVEPDLTPSDNPSPKIPIVVQLEPAKPRTLRLGGGVELDLIRADLHGSIGWEHRNFLGGLRKLSLEFRPGVVFFPTRLPDLPVPEHLLLEEKSRVELSQVGVVEARTRGMIRGEYNIYPVLLSTEVDPAASVIGYREFRSAVGLDRTWWKLFGQISYNFQRNLPFTYVGPLDSSLTGVTLSYVDLLLQLDFRNDKMSPHSGVLLANDLQVAGGPRLDDARDIRIQPDARVYLPISRRTTLALRGSLGFLFPFNYGSTLLDNAGGDSQSVSSDRAAWVNDAQITYFRAFYSGGPNSNRGYALRGVGPHGIVPFFNPTIAARELANSCEAGNPNFSEVRCAQPLGGMSLWEVSAEFRFPLSGALRGAVFCDTSDVSPRRLHLRFDYLHLSCGMGLRYATPVGPLRVDVGYRVPGLQILGQPDSAVEGHPSTLFGVPLALSLGIGEAF